MEREKLEREQKIEKLKAQAQISSQKAEAKADVDIEVQDSSNSKFGQQAAAASSKTSGGCETDIVPLKPKKKSLSASCIEARREREQDAKQRFDVTYDATGVGLRAGRQAEVLKKIVFELPELPAERALAEIRSLTGLLCHIPQVVYDATAVRLQAGRQPQTLNKIVCELTADNPLTKSRPLHGLLGHTPPQSDADIEVQDGSNSKFGQQAAATFSMISGGCETDIVPLKPKKKNDVSSCVHSYLEERPLTKTVMKAQAARISGDDTGSFSFVSAPEYTILSNGEENAITLKLLSMNDLQKIVTIAASS